MGIDWFEWFRNLLSFSGAFLILRYVAIAIKDGISKVWDLCVARDKNRHDLRVREEIHAFVLEREVIRQATRLGEFNNRFHTQGDGDGAEKGKNRITIPDPTTVAMP